MSITVKNPDGSEMTGKQFIAYAEAKAKAKAEAEAKAAAMPHSKSLDSKGQDFINEGQLQSDQAFADRTPYAVSDAILRQQNIADSALAAPDSVALQIKSQASAKASQLAATIGRNANSSSQSILGANLAVQQENAADRGAAVAAVGHRQQLLLNDQLATRETNQANDLAYELNVQQPFELNYQAGQNKINAGFQAKVQAAMNKGNSSGSIFSGIGSVLSAIGSIFAGKKGEGGGGK